MRRVNISSKIIWIFTLSYGERESTKYMYCNFINHTETIKLVNTFIIEVGYITSVYKLDIVVHTFFGIYAVICWSPIGPIALSHTDKAIINQITHIYHRYKDLIFLHKIMLMVEISCLMNLSEMEKRV